jgi:hypothetical protein
MAVYAQDLPCGLKYHSGPIQIKEFVAGAEVFEGALLRNIAGYVFAWAATSTPLGVAVHHATADRKIAVNVDPDTIYEVTDSIRAATVDDIGMNIGLTNENANLTINGHSAMLAYLTSASATPALIRPLQVVGLARNTTNSPNNFKLLVKVSNSSLEPFVDATV